MYMPFVVILTKIRVYTICFTKRLIYKKDEKKEFLTVQLPNNFNLFFKTLIFHKNFIAAFKLKKRYTKQV